MATCHMARAVAESHQTQPTNDEPHWADPGAHSKPHGPHGGCAMGLGSSMHGHCRFPRQGKEPPVKVRGQADPAGVAQGSQTLEGLLPKSADPGCFHTFLFITRHSSQGR